MFIFELFQPACRGVWRCLGIRAFRQPVAEKTIGRRRPPERSPTGVPGGSGARRKRLLEFGVLAGGIDSAAVGGTISRFGKRLVHGDLGAEMKRIVDQLSNS